jgi:hypothetical protein
MQASPQLVFRSGRWCNSARPRRLVGIQFVELLMTMLMKIGTLFRASQFLSEELPIRLAHRVEELNHLPDGLNEMPSIKKVKDWYAQSFEVCSTEATRI